MNLPESWVEVRIGQVLDRVNAKINPQSTVATSHFYIGLEHIEGHTGRLLLDVQAVTDGVDILSIKTAFKTGDILYGKLRPNLNKVYLATQDGICSTDIWVLRASSEILPEFAVQYLRSSAIHVRAAQLAAGANLPRVPAQAFDRIPLPLPTLPEQQRIVDAIAQAQSLGQSRQATQMTVELATRESYAEAFGDIVGFDKRWPVAKLGTLPDIVRGSSPRPQGDPRLFGRPMPRLMVSDLTRDGLWVNARVDSFDGGRCEVKPIDAFSVRCHGREWLSGTDCNLGARCLYTRRICWPPRLGANIVP